MRESQTRQTVTIDGHPYSPVFEKTPSRRGARLSVMLLGVSWAIAIADMFVPKDNQAWWYLAFIFANAASLVFAVAAGIAALVVLFGRLAQRSRTNNIGTTAKRASLALPIMILVLVPLSAIAEKVLGIALAVN